MVFIFQQRFVTVLEGTDKCRPADRGLSDQKTSLHASVERSSRAAIIWAFVSPSTAADNVHILLYLLMHLRLWCLELLSFSVFLVFFLQKWCLCFVHIQHCMRFRWSNHFNLREIYTSYKLIMCPSQCDMLRQVKLIQNAAAWVSWCSS